MFNAGESMEITEQELDAIYRQLGEAFKKESDELTQADYDAHCVVFYLLNQDKELYIN